MSIQDEIIRINQNVADTYSALGDMGATLPEEQNTNNMANTVRTLSQGSTDNTLKVTAEINPETMNAINPSHYITDIYNAYKQGKTVTLHLDISSMMGAEAYTIFPLGSLSAEMASFMGQIYMGEIYFFCVTIFNDSISTVMEALQTKQGGES